MGNTMELTLQPANQNLGIREMLQTWLGRFGLEEDRFVHPYSETDFDSDCFVPMFEPLDNSDLDSCFVVGPEGFGKTAQRLQTHQRLQSNLCLQDSLVLPIVVRLSNNLPLSATSSLDAVAALLLASMVVGALITVLETGSDSDREKDNEMDRLQYLVELISTYIHPLVSSWFEQVQECLKVEGNLSRIRAMAGWPTETAKPIDMGFANRAMDYWANRQSSFLSSPSDIPPILRQADVIQAIKKLKEFGFGRFVFMVDDLDTVHKKPPAIANLIDQLLKLTLQDDGNLCFQFYLTDKYFAHMPLSIKNKAKAFHLQWDKEKLMALITSRLRVMTKQHKLPRLIASPLHIALDQLLVGSGVTEEAVIQKGLQESPRAMLKYVHRLFLQQARRAVTMQPVKPLSLGVDKSNRRKPARNDSADPAPQLVRLRRDNIVAS